MLCGFQIAPPPTLSSTTTPYPPTSSSLQRWEESYSRTGYTNSSTTPRRHQVHPRPPQWSWRSPLVGARRTRLTLTPMSSGTIEPPYTKLFWMEIQTHDGRGDGRMNPNGGSPECLRAESRLQCTLVVPLRLCQTMKSTSPYPTPPRTIPFPNLRALPLSLQWKGITHGFGLLQEGFTDTHL